MQKKPDIFSRFRTMHESVWHADRPRNSNIGNNRRNLLSVMSPRREKWVTCTFHSPCDVPISITHSWYFWQPGHSGKPDVLNVDVDGYGRILSERWCAVYIQHVHVLNPQKADQFSRLLEPSPHFPPFSLTRRCIYNRQRSFDWWRLTAAAAAGVSSSPSPSSFALTDWQIYYSVHKYTANNESLMWSGQKQEWCRYQGSKAILYA